jgi:hypothetical protein
MNQISACCADCGVEGGPYCNSDEVNKTDKEYVEQVMMRVEANDAASINLLARYFTRE